MTRDGQARFARSAWFWLRAYPMRWRDVRGDEMVDLLTDLAAPDARRLGPRAAAATVAAGWRERWRTRPPGRTVLAYRLLGRRPARRHDGWLRDDIDSRWYPVWDALPITLVAAVTGVLLVAVRWVPWPAVLAGFVVGTASSVLAPVRSRAQRRARLFPEGVPPEIGPWLPYRTLDANRGADGCREGLVPAPPTEGLDGVVT